MNSMKKRWISLYVENQVDLLSKISGLFSGKSYNLDSLTVGTTEDPTVSRMTIATVSDDETFEQIKKQLNRLVEVIKVIDFTDVFVRMKEILYVKVLRCTPEDKVELFQIVLSTRLLMSLLQVHLLTIDCGDVQGEGHRLWEGQPAFGVRADGDEE